MTIRLWIPLNLVQYDELGGTSPANVWNGVPASEDPFDSDRIARLVRSGMVLTGVLDTPPSTGIRAAELTYTPSALQELTVRNSVLPVKWVDSLTNPEDGFGGEVEGWECAFRINATAYDSPVPNTIKGGDGRTWRQWRDIDQEHYWDGDNFYFVPSTALDAVPALGSEASAVDNETGINVIPRSELNAMIQQEQVQVVPIS